MTNFIVAVLLLITVTGVTALPMSQPSHGLFITPDNIRHFATYLDDSVSTSARYISISTGSYSEKLIEVPLAGPGELDSQVVIRLTVGLYPGTISSANTFIRVGVSDGNNHNQFYLYRTPGSGSLPCHPYNGQYDGSAAPSETYSTGEMTLYFQPFHKYGACHSSHDGGYVNAATFATQLDPTKGLSLLVSRNGHLEQYRIYYLMVEIM